MGERKTTYTAAKKASNKRYADKSTDKIEARLPRGYGTKVEQIAQILSTSKAQVLRLGIDVLYSKYVQTEGDDADTDIVQK